MATTYFSTNTELGLVNALTQSLTVFLPQAPINGKSIFIKDAAGNANNSTITIQTQGSDTFEIDSSTKQVINQPFGSYQLTYSSGLAKWYITGGTFFNTMTISSITTNVLSNTTSISSSYVTLSSLSLLNQFASTNTFNTVSSLLYYNNNLVGGGFREAVPQNVNKYISTSVFQPYLVSNLSFWFDASVSTNMSVSTNSTIVQWNYVSSLNNVVFNPISKFNLTTNSNIISNIGIYYPNKLNGFGALYCSTTWLAANNISTTGSFTGKVSLDTDFTTISLINYTNSNAPFYTSHTTNKNYNISLYPTYGQLSIADGIGAHTQQVTYTISSNTPYIIIFTKQSANTSIRVFGSNSGFLNTGVDFVVLGPTSNWNFNIATDVFNNFYNGYIHEIIHYNCALSISDMQRVEGYMAWKWNLQNNLISNHPFRWVQPY